MLTYPWTWAAIALNGLFGAALGIWFVGSDTLIAALVAAVSIIIGLVAWWIMLAVSGDLGRHAAAQSHDRRQTELDRLRAGLTLLDMPDAVSQISAFQEKLAAFEAVLQLRFSTDELTFQRYREAARQVVQGGLNNLSNLRATGESVRSIDAERLEARLTDMTPDDPQYPTLLERRALYQEQIAKTAQLLAENEQALTALTNVTTTLANTDVQGSSSPRDAIAALEKLASNAAKYAA